MCKSPSWGLATVVALVLCAMVARPAVAQELKLSGLAYVDYAYTLTSPTKAEEGENGFDYRRLYLTADYKLSDRFSGRARFEANNKSSTAEGAPAPFIKDLSFKWKNIMEGHDLIVGITGPPAFGVSEDFWGFRSIEKTTLDRNKIVSSRDFGVILKGKLTETAGLGYSVMFANNNGVRADDGNDRHKRIYGQLNASPTEALTITLGGDYASYGDDRTSSTTGNAFVGYRLAKTRVGVEGFYNTMAYKATPNEDIIGLSAFTVVALNPKFELLARFDHTTRSVGGVDVKEQFLIGGFSFSPEPNVHVMPNVEVSKFDTDDRALVFGRITLHVDF